MILDNPPNQIAGVAPFVSEHLDFPEERLRKFHCSRIMTLSHVRLARGLPTTDRAFARMN